MKRFLLSTAIVLSGFSVMDQSSYPKNEVFLSPIYFTEIGLGISLGYQYNINDKFSITLPVGVNWNENNMMYGPMITNVYKSTIFRIMPSFKYNVVNTNRVRYGIGPGISLGFGFDNLVDERYESRFNQHSLFVDNSFTLFNRKRNFGIGFDLGLGYHLMDNINAPYSNNYSFVFVKGAFKVLLAF